ncbi:hypothetical protein HDU79_004000 [Rhizoclosmatium sp. JEL0117]|nr:hypothetical protein HDU79_004000 [Rhizoclosmatium sp. JEL0117]
MSYLTRYPTTFKSTLGLQYPIIQGPFGGGASTVALTAAVSNSGGLGSYGAAYLSPNDISKTIGELRNAVTDGRPFSVNLWVPIEHDDVKNLAALKAGGKEVFEKHADRLKKYYKKVGRDAPPFPDKIGHNFEDQVQAALEANPPVLSFIMGVPPPHVIAEAKRRNIYTMATATTVAEALALEAAGIDAIVASGVEAAGHRGTFLPFNPTETPNPDDTTFTLVPRIRAAVKKSIPVIAAGGVSTPEAIFAALTLGADAVQIGTAFVVAQESGAAPIHKQSILEKSDVARTTVLTRAFSGRQARGIPNAITKEFYSVENELPGYPVQNYLTLPFRKVAGRTDDKDLLVLWCGQSGTLVSNNGSAKDILQSLVDGVDSVVARMKL